MADRKTKVIVPNIPDGNGDVIPTGVIMPDGRCLPVEKVINVTKGANMKIGVAGRRYTVLVCHSLGDYRQHSLWRDGDNWYVWEVIEDDIC